MVAQKFQLQDLCIEYTHGVKNKPTFVFVHGNTQNSSCGKGLIQFFNSLGHSTLCYDLPGHGKSDWKDYEYHFDDLVLLNHSILSHYDIENSILCGHSLGGMIQAATITRFNYRPVSLILCGSLDANPVDVVNDKYSELKERMSSYLSEYIKSGSSLFKKQKFYDYFENRQLDDAFIEIINRRYNHPDASKINLMTLSGFNVRKDLSSLHLPILIIHGKNETVIPDFLIEDMASHYQNVEVEWIQDAGHNAFYQKHELTLNILKRQYAFIVQTE
ncbi:alpha/beta fold hydrolase [Pleionea sediminis]|uniref:alpha/beta fold hydrolase n=1 Tax=Pleionea sediminis TaxID=2569479 RepID=UPI0011868C1C|nr:alpha/beta hydrolase [Pleionea sediminis]